jgi:hypothetical protein
VLPNPSIGCKVLLDDLNAIADELKLRLIYISPCIKTSKNIRAKKKKNKKSEKIK